MNIINVTVAYSAPELSPEWSGEIRVQLAKSVGCSATVGDAIQASNIAQHIQHFSIADMICGVWGKVKPLDFVLREGDRVEIYRPLQADPKDARRAKAPIKNYRKSPHT